MSLFVPSDVTSSQVNQTGSFLFGLTTGLSQSSSATPIWSGLHRFQGISAGTNLTLLVGSDAGGNSLTSGNAKVGSINTPHINSSINPVAAIYVQSNGVNNTVSIGGSAASFHVAATKIDFYTAANDTTAGGTRRGGFNAAGQFDIQTGLLVNGPLALSGITTASSANIGGATVPATAVGFITVNITGGLFKIPYYNV